MKSLPIVDAVEDHRRRIELSTMAEGY